MLWTVLTVILIVAAATDALGLLLWYSCSWPRSQVLGPALIHGPTTGKQIAITFDDGPRPPFTEQILDILRSRNISATFFVCGKDVELYPATVRRIQVDGHAIGNHTWSHPYLYFMSPARMSEEIDRTQRAVHQATGHTPELFRPPYGARWFGLYPILRKRRMKLVQWSLSGNDWKLDADEIIKAVCPALRPGAVILLHDGRQKPGGYLRALFGDGEVTDASPGTAESRQPGTQASETVKALPAIIDAALRMGYEFVSVEKFIRSHPEEVHNNVSG